MKKIVALTLALGLAGCGFVDEDGDSSFRQVAQGLRSFGDRVSELAEAIERDAGVESVPWRELEEVIPNEIDGIVRFESQGDEAIDKHGAGLSMAHARYVEDGDSMYVGVADLGALRSGAALALRWVAPLIRGDDVDGDVEEIEVAGYPAMRIEDDDDGDLLVVLLVEGRFAVMAAVDGSRDEGFVWDALEQIDYAQLEDWVDYGTR